MTERELFLFIREQEIPGRARLRLRNGVELKLVANNHQYSEVYATWFPMNVADKRAFITVVDRRRFEIGNINDAVLPGFFSGWKTFEEFEAEPPPSCYWKWAGVKTRRVFAWLRLGLLEVEIDNVDYTQPLAETGQISRELAWGGHGG